MNSENRHSQVRFADVDPDMWDRYCRFQEQMARLNDSKEFLDAAPSMIADFKRSDLSVPNEAVRQLLAAANSGGMTQIQFEVCAAKLRPNSATRKLKKNGEPDGLGGRLWHSYMNPNSDQRMSCHTYLQYLVEFTKEGWLQQEEAVPFWLTCTSIVRAVLSMNSAGSSTLYQDAKNSILQGLIPNMPPNLYVEEERTAKKQLRKLQNLQAKAGVALNQIWQRPPIDKLEVEKLFQALETALKHGEHGEM